MNLNLEHTVLGSDILLPVRLPCLFKPDIAVSEFY